MASINKGVTDAITDTNNLKTNIASNSSIIKPPEPEPVITNASSNKLDTGPKAAGQPTLNTPKEVLDSLSGWNENILSSIQQPAYRLRFFMAEDNPMLPSGAATYSDFYTKLNNRRQTTLAASGVTGLNILSLQITTIPALNKQTRNMSATTMTMVMKEIMGVNFMDDMAQAAKSLKIRNLSKCPYFIEISFHGYSEDGAMVDNVCDGAAFPNGGVWIYQVGIKNIASELDDTGTKYTLTLFPYQEKLYEQSNLQIPEAMTIEGATVGAILNGVAERWNASIEDSYGFQNNKYKFVIPKVQAKNGTVVDILGAKITPVQDNFAYKRSYAMDPAGNNGAVKVHLPKNMAVNDIVELVLANSDAAQKLGMDVTTAEAFNGAVKSDPKAAMRECIIFKAECTADLMGDATGQDSYDFSLENYVLEFTIHVLPYYTQVPILERQDVITAQDAKVQAQNAINLRQRGYLSKRYDYLYTGLNTEVKHVDIKFNLVWQAMLPRVLGTGITQESLAPQDKKNVDPRVVADEQSAKLKEANAVLRQVREKEEEHNLNQSEITRLTTAGKKEEAEKLRKADEESWSPYIKELNTPEGQAKLSAAAKTKAEAVVKLQAARNEINSTRLQQYNTVSTRSSLHEFADAQVLENENETFKIPVSFVQRTDEETAKVGSVMNDYYTNDRSVFGAVLGQMYGPMKDSLSQIAMDIKGDPYWLGASNFESGYRLAVRPADEVIRSFDAPVQDYMQRPDYTKGDILFLLSFKYPHGLGESGSPIMKNNDFFTGVYQTIKVTHKFESGYFSQRIEGNRMPLIEVYKAFGYQDPDDVKAAKEAAQKAEEKRKKDQAEKAAKAGK